MAMPTLRSLLCPLLLLTPIARAETSAATLPSGTPLQVRIEAPLPMRAGQPIRGHLVYAVYADNRIVLSDKTVVEGTILELRSDRRRRIDARLGGDLTPFHTPVVRFTSITLPNGTTLSLPSGQATDGAPVFKLVAQPPQKGGLLRQQWHAGMQMMHSQLALLTAPNKGDRLLQLFYHQLPYHPERVESGTTWTVETTAPITIPAEALPAPEPPTSVAAGRPQDILVEAYLSQDLSSQTAHPGEAIRAIVLEPTYNANHEMAVPQGSLLLGTVTTVRPARSFARQGALSFSFQHMTPPAGEQRSIETTLASADAAGGKDLQMDTEGRVKPRPNDRIIVPLLLSALATRPLDRDGGIQGGRNFVGANGIGLAGRVIAVAGGSPQIATGIGAYGAALSIYRRWIAPGREVSFPRNTRIVLETTLRNSTVLKPSSTR